MAASATPASTDPLEHLPFAAQWRASAGAARRVELDPGSVRDRMAMYRLLVEGTGSPAVVGSAGERHVFWGYAAQLHWQHVSGRLGDPAGCDDRIDPRAWWGNMNATLSVLPLRAAMRAGLLARVPLAPWPPLERGFEGPLARWERFFAELRLARPGDDLEPIRAAAWRAHLASIHEGLVRFERDFRRLPRPEQRFARGWTRMVELLGAAAIPTDLQALARWGAGTLPQRMLREGDRPGTIDDKSRRVERTVRGITALGTRPAWRVALDRWIWRRAMRERTLRAEAGAILFGERGRDPEVRRRVLRAAARP